MAIDRYVVGRVGEDHAGPDTLHKPLIALGLQRIGAEKLVFAEEPQVTRFCDGSRVLADIRHLIRRVGFVRSLQ